MYEIFEKLCNERGIRPYKVSLDTGISTATLTNWKKGNYVPKEDKLRKIADYFGVTYDYLTTGRVPDGYYEDDEVVQIAQSIRDRPDLRGLFSAVKDVSPDTINSFTNMILGLKNNERHED